MILGNDEGRWDPIEIHVINTIGDRDMVTQQEYPVEFKGYELKNEYPIADVCYGNGRWMTKMTTRIMTNDGIVTIFWE